MATIRRGVVTFLSDYGLEDEFVGVCHGVMLLVAPDLKIIDLNHNILRQDIRHGAVVLQQTVPYMPEAVHLAVVDPTVGSGRRAVVIETTAGHTFVGPDNGLFMPATRASGGIVKAHEITDRRFLVNPISRTFQGRDVFAPAAAHIANGVDPSELGAELDPTELSPLVIPEAWIHDDHLHGEVLQLDRFGNLQLNVAREQLEQLELMDGSPLEVRLEGHRLTVPLAHTFADVAVGEFVLVEDSYKKISLAINKGDARAKLRAGTGSTVIVGPSRT